MSGADDLKRAAALAAARLIASNMVVGLGSGSTTRFLTLELGAALDRGTLHAVKGVPTSKGTAQLASSLGIDLIDLPAGGVDLAIDGMDEVTDELDAIKGLGGALLREKIVAQSAARFVLIGDASKRVDYLGEQSPIPVEVLMFGWKRTASRIEGLGLEPRLRGNEERPFVSDNGNYVVDASAAGPFDAAALDEALSAIPGVLGHGLFLKTAAQAFVAGEDGVAQMVSG